jgi:hypothetical protein
MCLAPHPTPAPSVHSSFHSGPSQCIYCTLPSPSSVADKGGVVSFLVALFNVSLCCRAPFNATFAAFTMHHPPPSTSHPTPQASLSSRLGAPSLAELSLWAVRQWPNAW